MRRTRKRYTSVSLKTPYIPFGGGLYDGDTATINIPSGACRESVNVSERYNQGYETAQGYERFSGKTNPSSAVYSILDVTLSGTVSIGDTVATSEVITGKVIFVEDEYLVLSKVEGMFETGNLLLNGVVIGTCTGPQRPGGASTSYLNSKYTALAADLYRADIEAVPGSGVIRGLWMFNDIDYAFRDNAAATETCMYKSSSSGWQKVFLGYELEYSSGGTYEPQEGDVITGNISGATATITRVVEEDGGWTAGDSTGRFIFASKTGNFEAETITIGIHDDAATLSQDAEEIKFSVPGGTFDLITANFTGAIATRRIYGADGMNRGFEFDGEVFVPINTGMVPDTPRHVYAHHKHLFFSFVGIIQHSSPERPYLWSVVDNAAAFAMGDTITGFQTQVASESQATMCVTDRNSMSMLYGTGVDDWQLLPYPKDAGAIEWTVQRIGKTYMLDDLGISELATTSAYGNFIDATVSQNIDDWLKTKKNQVTCSCVIGGKNQYWIFFEDKSAICCTVDNGKIKSFMPFLFNHVVERVYAIENTSGNEIVKFGSSDGYVFQAFSGTSFDGDKIEWNFTLAYDSLKYPVLEKKMRLAQIEVKGDSYAEFYFSSSLEFGTNEKAQDVSTAVTRDLSIGSFDSGAFWDTGYWDGTGPVPNRFTVKGTGTNISMKLYGRSNMFNSLIFSGAFVQYTPTKWIR